MPRYVTCNECLTKNRAIFDQYFLHQNKNRNVSHTVRVCVFVLNTICCGSRHINVRFVPLLPCASRFYWNKCFFIIEISCRLRPNTSDMHDSWPSYRNRNEKLLLELMPRRLHNFTDSVNSLNHKKNISCGFSHVLASFCSVDLQMSSAIGELFKNSVDWMAEKSTRFREIWMGCSWY